MIKKQYILIFIGLTLINCAYPKQEQKNFWASIKGWFAPDTSKKLWKEYQKNIDQKWKEIDQITVEPEKTKRVKKQLKKDIKRIQEYTNKLLKYQRMPGNNINLAPETPADVNVYE